MKQNKSQIKKSEVKVAWVTFETMENKDSAMNMMNQTSLHRLYFFLFNWGCFKKYFEKWPSWYNNRLLRVRDTSDPSNVLWPNLVKTNKETLVRRIISWLIFSALIFYIIIILV